VATRVLRPSGIGCWIVLGQGLVLSVLTALTALALVLFSSESFCGQTRDQCEACCRNAGYDEYYAEQCRLKCFRHPDHCALSAPLRPPPPAAPPGQVQEPPPPPQEAAPPPSPPRASNFVWPNPLNLVPGREGEAAGQILTINGIPPQHPNFQAAQRNVQDVLVTFVRNNPGGGRLPTAHLERILRHFR
jgi:hypothetical protein